MNQWLPTELAGWIVLVAHVVFMVTAVVISITGAHRIAMGTKLGIRLFAAPVFVILLSVTVIYVNSRDSASIGPMGHAIIAFATIWILAEFARAARNPERY